MIWSTFCVEQMVNIILIKPIAISIDHFAPYVISSSMHLKWAFSEYDRLTRLIDSDRCCCCDAMVDVKLSGDTSRQEFSSRSCVFRIESLGTHALCRHQIGRVINEFLSGTDRVVLDCCVCRLRSEEGEATRVEVWIKNGVKIGATFNRL